MLPDFIGIGPGRTGTTLLYQVFKEHPEICTPLNTKETNFFTEQYHMGLGWYQSFFDYCDRGTVCGEISNTYIYDQTVARRIQEHLPAVKIISVLRDPFERMLSAFQFRQSVGEIPPDWNLDKALQEFPDLISDNFYGTQLETYFELFSEKQILVAFYDDLSQDPADFFQELFQFIGVDVTFKTDTYKKKVNPSKNLKFPFLAPMIRLYADSLRKLELFKILEASKNFSAVQKILFRKQSHGEKDQLLKKVQDKLMSEFLPEIKKVEALTGRDLSAWYFNNTQEGRKSK